MSRTYRRLKLKQPIKRLNSTNLPFYIFLYNTKYVAHINELIENSKLLKKEIALDFKDGTSAIWNVRGPHHFHNMKERRHRAECRDSIHRYVILYNKKNVFRNDVFKNWRIEDGWIDFNMSNDDFIYHFFPELDLAEPVLRSKPKREYWF